MKRIYFILEAVDAHRTGFAITDREGDVLAKQQSRFAPGKMNLLWRIEIFLRKHQFALNDISGIIAVTGPGSFTSIRTSLSIVNTWASVSGIPNVGVFRSNNKTFHGIIRAGLLSLKKRNQSTILKPFYGRPPEITKPKASVLTMK